MEVLPSLKKLWQDWDLRVMVLLSLTLQVVLILLGNRRKYNHKFWIGAVVWLAYLTADSIATVALGVISSTLKGMHNNDIRGSLTTLWASFLLLHLGGPDTITAYSLEDNELWLRHLLGLVVQTTAAISILFIAWTGSRLSVISLLILFAGVVKYGERTWVLRSASIEQFRESIGKEVLGSKNNLSSHDDYIEATKFLAVTKCVFIDDIPSSGDRLAVQCVFRNLSFESAFKIVEIQLGLIYDLFYTKTPLLYTRLGFSLRLICFLLICLVLVFFCAFFLSHREHKFSKVDLCISLLLVVVAIILEIYAALSLLFSDQFSIFLRKNNFRCLQTIRNSCPILSKSAQSRRWSNNMSQFSLLEFSKREKHLPCKYIMNVLQIDIEKQERQRLYVTDKEVSVDLKEFMYEHLKEQAGWDSAALSRHYGQNVTYKLLTENKVQAILDYHVITEVMYETDGEDIKKKRSSDEKFVERCEFIKQISRYMCCLLFMESSMLSIDLVQLVSLRRQIEEAVEFLPRIVENYGRDRQGGYGELSTWLGGHKESDEYFISGMKIVVTELLQRPSLEAKWNSLGRKWLDILTYVAMMCKGREHGQRLTQGGELLTHVRVLLALFDFKFDDAIQGCREISLSYYLESNY